MMRITRFLALAVTACLTACYTPTPRVVATSIRQGMTRAELQSAFGRPLRIERQPDGSEDWFYNFGGQERESHPISESVVTATERSYSVGHATTTTTTMSQNPIHLSPDGRVVGAIPAGSVIVE
jgi:outer membrane protein assembly factor BamE (lipoprotein component of BamABCDE complex)